MSPEIEAVLLSITDAQTAVEAIVILLVAVFGVILAWGMMLRSIKRDGGW